MSTLLHWFTSPVGGLLWKGTTLLALGWLTHGCLRRRHARWRLILWRSLLVLCLALPAVSWLSLPLLTISIQEPAALMPMETEGTTLSTGAKAVPSAMNSSKSPVSASAHSAIAKHIEATPAGVTSKTISWKAIILAVWLAGCAWGTLRLIWFWMRLRQLRSRALPAEAEVMEMASRIRTQLDARRDFDLLISEEIHSPFVCGLRHPAIMLPTSLVEALSVSELAGLLRHEAAHLRGHDLWWSAGWRWVQIIGWFHPLVWRIPAAHNLACEEEADRVASERTEERVHYAQLLAQLALRVLTLPAVETKLTLNGSAQIVRRLQQLQRKGAGVWKRRHTVAGVGLTVLLFMVAISCTISRNDKATGNLSNGGFKEVTVVVQDETGQPIAGASVMPFGYRVKGIHGADAYGWRTNVFGPREASLTDTNGTTSVRYAVMGIPEEKEYTGALCFTVTHPNYSTVTIQDFPVDEINQPIHLIKGITLEVSGWCGANDDLVMDFTPILSDKALSLEDWVNEGRGVLAYHKLSPGGHLILLMGRLSSGEIVYSDYTAFIAEKGKVSRLALEMKPGIRLEGRLDANVPRPVRNARVMMDVRPKQWPALNVIEDYYAFDKKFGGRNFWHSYRSINSDGTFVFESVPPGEVDLVVHGEGFAGKTEGQLTNRVDGALVKGPVMAIPQAFVLRAPLTQIVVKTEPTATLEFKAKTKQGQPIEGVWVGMFPSVFRMWGKYGWMKESSETIYREIPRLPDLVFSGETDQTGRLVIQNIPAETRGLDVDSRNYQVPLQDPKGWRDRHVRMTFMVGETNRLELTMEPKGTDYIGTAK